MKTYFEFREETTIEGGKIISKEYTPETYEDVKAQVIAESEGLIGEYYNHYCYHQEGKECQLEVVEV